MTNLRFAFRIYSGLAIVSYDAVPMIQKWIDQSQPTNPSPTPSPKDLSHF